MVVRREGQGYRTYCHFGTGNYHPVTARIYTDLSFFTADPRAGRDAAQLFNYITGYVEPERLDLITMSPLNMRAHLCALIDAETEAAREGRSEARRVGQECVMQGRSGWSRDHKKKNRNE